jgi:hypothetical protein
MFIHGFNERNSEVFASSKTVPCGRAPSAQLLNVCPTAKRAKNSSVLAALVKPSGWLIFLG